MNDQRIPPTGTWWHVYPLGLLGAEREALADDSPVAHRLAGLIPYLDYSAHMGVEGWVLGPLFASESHGYDTIDHFEVDRRLGDTDDLVGLLAAAHERGIRVVLDGVFNHVARGFGKFAEAVAQGPESEAAQWFSLHWPDDGGPPTAAAFEGHDALVNLNHAHPAVLDYVVDVMTHWAAKGADGWRLDAAYAAPAEFWRAVVDRVKPAHPDLWLFGEVIHGDYAAFVAATGLDSVTQYELWKAIPSALNDANFFELAHALGRHEEFLTTFVPVTFVGNHDTTRIASALNDVAHLPHALAVLFSVGGTPVVYAGDEQGYRGVKFERFGGDDEVRPPFPALPEHFSTLGRPTFDLHAELIAFRNAHPWLTAARTEVTHLTNTSMVLVSTGSEGRIATGLCLGAGTLLPLPAGAWRTEVGDGAPGPDGLGLPEDGWAILVDGP